METKVVKLGSVVWKDMYVLGGCNSNSLSSPDLVLLNNILLALNKVFLICKKYYKNL